MSFATTCTSHSMSSRSADFTSPSSSNSKTSSAVEQTNSCNIFIISSHWWSSSPL